MKFVLRIGAALVALAAFTASSSAADAPKGPVYKAAPVFNWSGYYIGGQIGYGWGESNWTNAAGVTTGDFDIDGVVGGLTLGRNWQAAGSRWVFGIEGDISAADISGSTAVSCGAATPCVSKVEWLGTVRGRIGYAQGTWLFYGTGGVAFGGVNYSGAGIPSTTETEVGWTAGAGIEAMLGRNWSWKVEYLYVDFGRSDIFFAPTGITATNEIHIARLGVNYRW
jgi:outer membrane immunogenic protein